MISLPRDIMAALLKIAPKDGFRPQIEGIHFVGGKAYSSDGYMLAIAHVEYDKTLEGKTLSRDGLELALRLTPRKLTNLDFPEASEQGITASCGPASIFVRFLETDYPAVKKFEDENPMPAETATTGFAISIKLGRTIFEAFRLVVDYGSVRIYPPSSPAKPIWFATSNEPHKFRILAMPMFVEW